jgi:hypothetical protein
MADPLPAVHQAYFSHAIETLETTPERRELLEIIADGAALMSTALKLNMGTQDRFDPLIDIIADSCATLHG